MASGKPALSLRGLFPPLTTPFDQRGDVAYEQFRANVDKLNAEPLAGYVVGGSNGEVNSLTIDERVAVVRACREAAHEDRLVIGGSGTESTRQTIEVTHQMADAGADAALVVTPSYYKARMTPAALEEHYRQVADASSIPVILYNVPGNTGIDLPASSVVRLSEHPRIIGIKDSGGDITKMGLMLHQVRPDFQILAGSASYYLATLLLGGVGTVSALGNLAPRMLDRMTTAFRQGDLAEARAIQLRIIEPNLAVTARFGVPGLKAALDLLGYHGGAPRLPLQPLPDEDRETLRTILGKAGLLDR